MTLFRNKYRVESIRLKEYDYSQPGYYFITICIRQRKCIFGEIVDNYMQLSVRGMIIKKFFQQIGQYFNNVGIDIYAIMPNHIHAIIIIKDVVDVDNGVVNYCRDGVIPSLQMEKSAINKPTLGQIIGYFKYQTTKNINQINKTVGIKIWQPRYYEHIIRDDDGLNKIRQYILNNPKNWNLDKNNPEHC